MLLHHSGVNQEEQYKQKRQITFYKSGKLSFHNQIQENICHLRIKRIITKTGFLSQRKSQLIYTSPAPIRHIVRKAATQQLLLKKIQRLQANQLLKILDFTQTRVTEIK